MRAPVASAENSRWREIAELDDRRRDRRQQHHRERPDQPERAVVVAADEQQHVGDPGDRAADRRRDARGQDVAVADVGQLVGEHAAQLGLAEQLRDALA